MLFEVTSYQLYVLLQQHSIYVHANCIMKSQSSLFYAFCACHSTIGVRTFLLSQQWNYLCNILTITVPSFILFQVGYNFRNPSRRKQDTGKLCTFPTPRVFLRQQFYCKSCSRVLIFGTLRIEERKTRQWLVLWLQFLPWWGLLHTIDCPQYLVLQHFNINSCIFPFVAETLRHKNLPPIYNLKAIWGFGERFVGLCRDIWVSIFIKLFSCVFCWLYEAVENFLEKSQLSDFFSAGKTNYKITKW